MRRRTLIAWVFVAAALATTLEAQFLPQFLTQRLRSVSSSADVTAPSVSITTPATDPFDAGSTTPQTVSGTASDAVGVTGVTWANASTGNGGACTGTTSWSCSVPVANGSNLITIAARDAALNEGTDTVTITFASGAGVCADCVFETSFLDADCAAWDQSDGLADADVCQTGDGIAGAGSWTSGNGSEDEIAAAANFAGGLGGKGFRHYRSDGHNSNGGGLTITIPSAVTEFWVRVYMRYVSGFAWSPTGQPLYTKDLYWGACGSGCIILGIQGSNSWGANYNGSTNYSSSLTWATSMGGDTGDGTFHCHEWHIEKNGASSVIEYWLDGTRYLNKTDASLGSASLQSFLLGSNQRLVTGAGATDYTTDYDDLAVSATQQVGCF